MHRPADFVQSPIQRRQGVPRVSARLLIVEDDHVVVVMLEAALQYGGFQHHSVSTAADALAAVADDGFDAVLLDLGLPDVAGEDLLPILRRSTSIPIIVISGRATEEDKIRVLDLGADDFMAKPFLAGELLARIRAVLRRPGMSNEPIPVERLPIQIGKLAIDPIDRSISVGSDVEHLNVNEYRILRRLAQEPGRYVSRSSLSAEIHGEEASQSSKAVDVYLSRVRAKLRRITGGEELIVSGRGLGWILRADT
jgi:two-component system KDP operon response regulator KdpE